MPKLRAACTRPEASPVALITDLKVLACMTPVVGGHVVVAHPHEALATQDGFDRGVSHGHSCPSLCVLAHRHPL